MTKFLLFFLLLTPLTANSMKKRPVSEQRIVKMKDGKLFEKVTFITKDGREIKYYIWENKEYRIKRVKACSDLIGLIKRIEEEEDSD